jgi:CubicO group peptidase (beta-lactamase class C family)
MLNDPMHRDGDGMGWATAMLAIRVRLASTVHGGLYMHSDWLSDKPEKHGLDPRVLACVLEDGAQEPGLRSLLVVRNGFLVGERYYGGASAADLQPLNSITKSVTSVLVGQALQRGVIRGGLSATVRKLLPGPVAMAPDSPAANVTVAQILSGRTGLSYDWQMQYDELISTPDLVSMALALPADPIVPRAWTYNDPVVALISPILSTAEVAARDLFTPLGIERYEWARDKAGRSLSYAGLALRPRDLMKVIWTMAEEGKWQGHSVIPGEWVGDSTRSRGAASWRVRPVTDIGYGYLWFTGFLHGHAVVWGWGYGGQFALWVPMLRLAVATAAVSPPAEQLVAQTGAIMARIARLVQAAR